MVLVVSVLFHVMVNQFAEYNKDFASGCTRFRQVKTAVVVCSSGWNILFALQ